MIKKISYKDYIDKKRIEEFKSIAAEEKNKIYDIPSLALMAGFNSKASFYRIFKQLEGMTPKEYLNAVNNN